MVSSASFQLYTFAAWGEGADGDFTLHRISRNWDPRIANWIGAESGIRWTTAGGDYVATQSGAFVLRGGSGQSVNIDVKAATQYFINNPAQNFGLIIVNSAGVRGPFFNASESANAARRPKLTITYESNTAVERTQPASHMRVVAPERDALILGLDGRVRRSNRDDLSVSAALVVGRHNSSRVAHIVIPNGDSRP